MKQLFLFVCLGLCANIYATVRTVSNNPGTVAQYTTIQSAVDAAVSGDTIYIHGSSASYGTFNVTDKRLTYIGPGWSPLRSLNPLTASIGGFNFVGAGCDNSEIQGLVFTGQITIGFNHPNGIRFIRNQFISCLVVINYSTTNYSGFVFQDNWFDRGQIVGNQNNSYTNCVIQNNIFYHNTTTTANIYGLTNSVGVLIDHNLFYGPASGNGVVFAGDCKGLLITNNIFVRRNAAVHCTNSTFNNNITYLCGVDDPWAGTYGNIGNNNVAGQDPQMVGQTAVNGGTNDPLLNFTIAAGPANNSGTDSKDMGLLFDATGILNWSNSRMSRIPYVYSMNISNPNIPAGGTLNVQVEARKNN
jgi:hypothetical protein